MEFTAQQIAQLVGGNVIGDNTVKISKLAKIQEADKQSISFLSNPKYENFIYTTEAGAVIVNKNFVPKSEIKTTLIQVEDPYTGFTTLLEEYQKIINFIKVGVEEPSFIGEKSVIGSNLYRGAFSYIGKNCKIGDNVKIYPHVYIGDNVTIGNNVILYSGVKIHHDTKIGNNCTFQAGAVIGSDGFGFAPQADGSFKTIPQVGNVIIGNNVDIGVNTVIDRATMGSTLIEDGVKLDNLIQIGHNVEIGKNTVMAAQVGISGSTKIGENCMLGGQVGISGHLKIANRTSFGAKTGVIKTITEEGTSLMGYPALELNKAFKSFVVYKNLPELQKRIKELEEKVVSLTSVEKE